MPKKLTSKEVRELAEKEAERILKEKYNWFFKERIDKGFDLLFEDAEGNQKYVEVKGRTGRFTNTFVDKSEWEFADTHRGNHLFLFIEFDDDKMKSYKILKIEDFKEIKNGEKIERPGFKGRHDFQIYF